MVKRRRTSSSSSIDSPPPNRDLGFSIRLRDKKDIRPPDRLTYTDPPNKKDKGKGPKNGKGGGRKGSSDVVARKRRKLPSPRLEEWSDPYPLNLFTWARKPKFIQRMDSSSRSAGDAPALFAALALTPSSSSAPNDDVEEDDDDVMSGSTSVADDFRHLRDEIVFMEKHPRTRDLFSRIYESTPPSDPTIPSSYWNLLRPCDRFLLLKRLLLVDVTPSPPDFDVITHADRPDFADAKKVLQHLAQLHLIFYPDLGGSVTGLNASLVEIHNYRLHPLRRKSKKEVRLVSVKLSDDPGRLELIVAGDGFRLELWSDERDFTLFLGRYVRELLPSARVAFRASAGVEDRLWLDPDFKIANDVSIQSSINRIKNGGKNQSNKNSA